MKEKLSGVKERVTREIFSNLETINRFLVMTRPLSALIAGATVYLGSKTSVSVSNISVVGTSNKESPPKAQRITQIVSVSYLLATFEQYQKSASLRDNL